MNPLVRATLLPLTTLTLAACGLSGPGSAEIEKIAKQQMAAQLEDPNLPADQKKSFEESLAKAKVSKKGICNNAKKDVYACMVDITIKIPGANEETTQTFVVELTKADGGWKAVQ